MHCELHHAHGDVVPFRVLCAVRTRLQSRWWFHCTLLFVQLFASRASSRCKQDMGALSWFNAETPERVPTPLFGRLVRCSTHGPFFARLRYIHYSHTITHTCQTHKNTKTALDTNILIYPHTHTHMRTSSHTYNYKHKRLDQKLIGAITAGMAIAVPVFVSLLAGSVKDWFNIQTLRNIIQLLLMNTQTT